MIRIFLPLLFVLLAFFAFWGAKNLPGQKYLPGFPNLKSTQSLDIDNRPFKTQILDAEAKYKPDTLRGNNKALRDSYAKLVVLWFSSGNSFSLFGHLENDKVADKIINSISWIEEENDTRRIKNEEKQAWTYESESITIDLSTPEINIPNTQYMPGHNITLLEFLRRTMVHEMVHFVCKIRYDSKSFEIFRKSKPDYADWTPKYVKGFKVGFTKKLDQGSKDYEFLRDFNEAATELIAYEMQWKDNLPSDLYYGSPNVDNAIKILQIVLGKSGMTVDDLAQYSSDSDLDGLALRIADATTYQFKDENEKLNLGLTIIAAIDKSDFEIVEEYFLSSLKA